MLMLPLLLYQSDTSAMEQDNECIQNDSVLKFLIQLHPVLAVPTQRHYRQSMRHPGRLEFFSDRPERN